MFDLFADLLYPTHLLLSLYYFIHILNIHDFSFLFVRTDFSWSANMDPNSTVQGLGVLKYMYMCM